MAQKRVVLYSQPGCPPCTAAKSYLKSRGVEFEYKDVSVDSEALLELTVRYQSRSTPTIVVGDAVMIGFEPEKLDAMLAAE